MYARSLEHQGAICIAEGCKTFKFSKMLNDGFNRFEVYMKPNPESDRAWSSMMSFMLNTEGVVSWEDRLQRGDLRETDPECFGHVMRTTLARLSRGTSWTRRCWSQMKSMPLCLAIRTGASRIKMLIVKLRHEPMHTAVECQPLKKDKFVKFVSKSRGWGFAM